MTKCFENRDIVLQRQRERAKLATVDQSSAKLLIGLTLQ